VRPRVVRGSTACSFDHLVGAGEERGWDREAKGFGRSVCNCFRQFKLSRLIGNAVHVLEPAASSQLGVLNRGRDAHPMTDVSQSEPALRGRLLDTTFALAAA
jgi:hypothetical protein